MLRKYGKSETFDNFLIDLHNMLDREQRIRGALEKWWKHMECVRNIVQFRGFEKLSGLHFAAANHDVDGLLRYLAQYEPSPTAWTNLCSPLHIAARSGSASCINVLLDYGFSAYDEDENGLFPVHYLLARGHANMQFISERDRAMFQDVNYVDCVGNTLGHYYVAFYSQVPWRATLPRESNKANNDWNFTALHAAAAFRDAEFVHDLHERDRLDGLNSFPYDVVDFAGFAQPQRDEISDCERFHNHGSRLRGEHETLKFARTFRNMHFRRLNHFPFETSCFYAHYTLGPKGHKRFERPMEKGIIRFWTRTFEALAVGGRFKDLATLIDVLDRQEVLTAVVSNWTFNLVLALAMQRRQKEYVTKAIQLAKGGRFNLLYKFLLASYSRSLPQKYAKEIEGLFDNKNRPSLSHLKPSPIKSEELYEAATGKAAFPVHQILTAFFEGIYYYSSKEETLIALVQVAKFSA